MKQFRLAFLAITLTSSLFSMKVTKELFFQGHPCLPKEFYRGIYAEILTKLAECPEAKSGLQEFVDNRLKMTTESFENNKPEKWSCQIMAMLVSVHLSNYGRDEEASIISQYSHRVSELFAFAIRKKFGVRVEDQIALETWPLKQITEAEYADILDKCYTKEILEKVMLIEEIHAHRMLYELAGIKKENENLAD